MTMSSTVQRICSVPLNAKSAPEWWLHAAIGLTFEQLTNGKNVSPVVRHGIVDSVLFDEEVHDGYRPGFSAPVSVYNTLSRDAFAKLLATAGERAGIDRRLCHPHALRHAAGHALANSGKVNAYQLQAVLRHKDARSTQVYVQGVEGLIKGLWD
jgi:integrase